MEDTKPKTFVFVLMPFNSEFADTYEVGIKQACKDAGAYCERVDEQIFEESILERVYNQISKADVIVAEMTGRNPNVFYETGYAHALNKRVILLTQDAEDIPFDLKHYPHIVYGGKIAALKSQLEAKIRWCIDNPKDSLSNADVMLDFYVDKISLSTQPEIDISFSRDPHQAYINFSKHLVIHNVSTKTIHPEVFNLAIELPPAASVSEYDFRLSKTILPNGRLIFNLQEIPALFPDGWYSLILHFNVPVKASPIDVLLRMYTELGATDYPFTFKLNERVVSA
jgi:hypothetical protein